MTVVSTTCAKDGQSLTTVLLRTPITQMIFFNQGMLLLGSNHFLKSYSHCDTNDNKSDNDNTNILIK